MLTRRSCHDCGRYVRLSTTIQPPRCPDCRLSCLPAPFETRPCLRCRVQIPAAMSDPYCTGCQIARLSDVPCRDCGTLFPARYRLVRCPDCRSRRSNTVPTPVDFGRLYTTSFNPFVNSFLAPIPTRQTPRRPLPPPRPLPQSVGSGAASFAINQGVRFLRQEHESRVYASSIFPPEISPSHIRLSVRRFEKDMALASRDTVCGSCGKLVPLADIRRFLDGDPVLRPLEGFLDTCGHNEGLWCLCSSCHSALLRGSVPKFSAKNLVNVTLCQHYPNALEDLTLTEEYLIAKSHPVGVVLKLRLGGQTSLANYRALRGYFIIIP